MITLTEEQQAFLAAIRDTSSSIVLNARAGAGKTFALEGAVKHLRGDTLVTSFNRSIMEELKARIEPKLSLQQRLLVNISTAHSHGLSAFRRSGLRPETQGGKMAFILKDTLRSYPDDDDIHRNARHIRALASAAKNMGFGIQSTYERFPDIEDDYAWQEMAQHFGIDLELEGDFSLDSLVSASKQLLKDSNNRIATVDFDDMIYLPLLKGLNIPRYDNVAIDEAQDINPTRRELMFRSLKPDGRVVAVGDPYQAIYGFTGADPESLKKIRDRSSAVELYLTICWRCDEAIITEAQKLVPDIKARPNAPTGQVVSVEWTDNLDFLTMPKPGDAILCRLNKPNVAIALGLIRRGVPARIEGADLGKKLLDHIKKAAPMHLHQPLPETLIELETYLEAELQLLYSKKRESAAAQLQDEVEAAQLLVERVIETGGKNFRAIEQLASQLFGNDLKGDGIVTLSSIHKAKGREWPTVYILGRRDYMPFHLAEKAGGWQLEQEYNLIYVGDTRARNILIHVNGVQSAIDRGLHRKAPKA